MRTKVRLIEVNVLFCLLSSLPTAAQVIPDATLPINSNVTSEGNTSTIIGGTQAGSNLFHSFEQFSLSTGGTAYFNNTSDIQNIFSRVTGSSISNIDGLIRANGSTNLFLLNPNGIFFGSNARLNIGGSFVGSTASSVNFTDGSHFSATNSQATPILTVNVPVGLNLGSNPGAIRVQGTGHNLINYGGFFPIKIADISNSLQVQPGKTLALIGGDVALDGGVLAAEGGRVELGSIENGMVSLSLNNSGLKLGYQNISSFKDVHLSNRASLNSSGSPSGSIQIQGRQVTLDNGSVILNQNQGVKISGSININASELLEIDAISPNINNGTREIASSLLSETLGTGQGGDIEVSAKNLIVKNGGQILTSTFSEADGGNLKIRVFDSIKIIGYSKINRQFYSNIASGTFVSGKGGNISVFTEKLSQLDGGTLGSITFGTGIGGDVFLKANNLVEIFGIEPVFVQPSAIAAATINSGNAGNVTIITSRLVAKDGGGLTVSTGASGSAGTIEINASDFVEVSGTSPDFKIGSFITSSAEIINQSSQQRSKLPEKTSGESGKIRINTGQLSINNGGIIGVLNEGTGDAGTLEINTNSLNLDDSGSITAATASGEGGNIFLRSQNLQLRGSNITANAGNNGNGGNIDIDTDLLTVLERSEITADAFQGRGGNIKINTQGLFRSSDSTIRASSNFGINGTVKINTLFTDPSNGSVELPQETLDATGLIAQGCPGNVAGKSSSFTVTGRGGLPENPFAPLNAEAPLWTGWRSLASAKPQSTPTKDRDTLPKNKLQSLLEDEPISLVEADSWQYDPQGNIVFTASVPTTPSLPSLECHTLDHLKN